MTLATRIALAFGIALASAPRLHGQNKPTPSTPDTIPFQTSAFQQAPPHRESPDFMDTIFRDSIPVGKRLIVQHVSVNFFAVGVTEPVVGAQCVIQALEREPRGSFDFVAHFIPLSIQQNLTRKTVSYTGGQAITAYMEAGQTQAIQLQCFGGIPAFFDGTTTARLQAQLTGLLVNK
jgi:hypothetical protein